MNTSHLILVLWASLLLHYPSNAQLEKGSIGAGQSIQARFDSIEQHRYSLSIKKKQLAFLRLRQDGIDLKITTFDREGQQIQVFDSPDGTEGYESFYLSSDKSGTYSFVVEPRANRNAKGRYTLEFVRVKNGPMSLEDRVDLLFLPWDSDESPGASTAITRNGRLLYSRGYGRANLEYGIPIEPSTVFHVASVSKQFTAFAILLLEREGRLKLDDDVRTFVPELPDFGPTITLRHLANHTSGLRDQWNLLAMAGWRLDDVITREHILRLVERQRELNFDPGEEYLYCNTGYTLLAEVVSRVSGKSFADFCRERIFEPLGMNHSLFYDDHQKIVRNRAYSYFADSTGLKKGVLNYANVGATSLFSTAEDLSKWALNFRDPRVGDRRTITLMNSPGTLNSGDTINYTLGQATGVYKGLKYIGHDGSDAGYRSFIARFPEQDFEVVVLGNLASLNPRDLAFRIAEIYLEDALPPRLNIDIPRLDSSMEQEKSVADRTEVPVATLNSYTGDYQLKPGFSLSISTEDKGLYLRATGQSMARLNPLSLNEFEAEGVEARLTFVPEEESGEVNRLILEQGGNTFECVRTDAFALSTTELEEFEGIYYSDELQTSYEFVVEDGKLFARHVRHPDIELSPVEEDLFEAGAWYLGQIRIYRGEWDEILGCTISSGRVRNLKFIKE